MRALKVLGRGFWRFMIIFSFIVNLVLVIVLLVLGLLIFDIKNNIAQPLVAGLHSSFVGLDDATIDWTIPVRDTIPVKLNIALEQDTIVKLTEDVPLVVNATINLPGVGVLNNAQVNLRLPKDLELPVKLDLDVPVDQMLDVSLDVRAVIPLKDTQLHDVAQNLRLLFEPLVRALYNLPNNFNEAGALVGDILAGRPVDLLKDNAYTAQPWPGFSQTAGLNYTLTSEPAPPANLPLSTGIVPVGGIPALDEQIRPEIYAQGGPQAINAQAASNLQAQMVPAQYYNGQIGDFIELSARPSGVSPQTATSNQTATSTQTVTGTGGPITPAEPGGDLGIMPTPTGGG